MDSAAGTTWVPSRGGPPGRILMMFIFLGIAWAIVAILALPDGITGLVGALEFRSGAGTPGEGFAAYLMGVGVPILVVLVMVNETGVKVGLGPFGILVVSRLGKTEVAWENLRPPSRSPSEGWAMLNAYAGPRPPLHFWVSREQARAILSDPRAPARLFPSEYWSWVGLPVAPA